MTQNQLSLESVDLRDKEKELKDLLKNRLLNIGYDFSKVQITYLGDDVFAIGYENRIGFFCNSEGNNYFNLKSLSINYFFEKASILAGYKEIKRKDGIYEMYKIKEINKKGDKIDTKLGEKLDKYSLENFQAWQNIDFFENLLLIKTICIADGNLESTNLKLLSILSKSGALRIKNIEQFKKQGQITDEIFKQAIALYQTKENNLLLQQIGDERFERVNEGITQKEIEDYHKKGYISENLYKLAMEKIEEFENLEDRKQKEIKKQLGENKKAIQDL